MDTEHIAIAILVGAIGLMFVLLAREVMKANRNYDESMRKRQRK